MAPFMLFSRLKPSIFLGAYAKCNAPLSLLQLFRARSTQNLSIPATKPHIVWIEIKDGTSETRHDDTYWVDILHKIHDEVADKVSVTQHSDLKIVLSGSSMVESLGSHICAYQGDRKYIKVTNANTLSIYTTLSGKPEEGEIVLCSQPTPLVLDETVLYQPPAKKLVDIIHEITSKYLEGETYVKIEYEALMENVNLDVNKP